MKHFRKTALITAVLLCTAGAWLWHAPAGNATGVAPGGSQAAAGSTKGSPATPASPVGTISGQQSVHAPGAAKPAPENLDTVPAPIVAFTDWLASWRQAGPEAHAELAVRGHPLAVARRAALNELLAANPRLALEQAIPRSLRAELPADVVAGLENPVDAFGRLEVIAACFGTEDRTDRWVVIGERSYEAHVYGRHLEALSKEHLAIHGIAIDNRLAVSELPYRRLESAELSQQVGPEALLTVAVGDKTMAFPSAEALAA